MTDVSLYKTQQHLQGVLETATKHFLFSNPLLAKSARNIYGV